MMMMMNPITATATDTPQPPALETLDPWRGFTRDHWCQRIDVRLFIQKNVTPYLGEANFLAPATPRTEALHNKVKALFKQERDNGGVLAIDTDTPSAIDAYKAGYIDAELERIVGLQTDAPLKRAIMPAGGLKMVVDGCAEQKASVPEWIQTTYKQLRKTHNEGVFNAYTPEMRACRSSGVITGLPDAYGRGRIIGDYRRLALYGT